MNHFGINPEPSQSKKCQVQTKFRIVSIPSGDLQQ